MEEQANTARARHSTKHEVTSETLFVYIDASFAVHLLRKECCTFLLNRCMNGDDAAQESRRASLSDSAAESTARRRVVSC